MDVLFPKSPGWTVLFEDGNPQPQQFMKMALVQAIFCADDANHAPNWWSCVRRGYFRAWPLSAQSELDDRTMICRVSSSPPYIVIPAECRHPRRMSSSPPNVVIPAECRHPRRISSSPPYIVIPAVYRHPRERGDDDIRRDDDTRLG
jgi:hypothetical protein